MGIFNFFKRIFEKERAEEIKEKVAYSEIERWIEKKGEEIEVKEKEILILLKNKISLFVNELEERTGVLENFDVEAKKVEDKFKSIVNESRKNYIEFVKSLIKRVSSLEEESLEKFSINLNKILTDFNKNTHIAYEKTTILIGKETADIKGGVNSFLKYLVNVFNENRNLMNSSKTIHFIKLKLRQIEEINKTLAEIDRGIIFSDKKIVDKKEANKKTLEEIEKIKKSRDYLKYLEEREKIKSLEGDLEKDFPDLKQLIAFKALANFFHVSEKQMNIVKAYKEDFQTNFKKDSGAGILNLLNEAKLNTETIAEKIKQIKFKEEEIEKNKKEIKKDKTQELYSETTKLLLEIGSLRSEIEKEERRKEKLKKSIEEISEVIKENIGKVGGEVV